MDLTFLHMNLIMNSGGVNPIHFKNPNISSRFVGKKKHISQYRGYPPDSLETSTLASMISQPPRCPGAAAFPATTKAAKADLSAACSSCRDCCQLQTLILGKRHKDQRFQWKVNLKIIWLWVKICQNGVPQSSTCRLLRKIDENHRISGVLFFTAIINGCGTMGMAWWGRSSLGPPSAPWKLAARHGFYTMKSTGCSSHWAEDTLQLVTF